MNIKAVTDYNDLLKLESDWVKLFDKSGSSNMFLSWQWCSLWWKHFGESNGLMLLEIRDEGELVGIAPLMVYKMFFPGFNRDKVCFIGGGLVDYTDFLVLRDNRIVVELIMNFLVSRKHYGSIVFDRIPETSLNLTCIKEVISKLNYPSMVNVSTLNPYIKIESEWDDYRKTIKRGLKWLKMNYALKKFSKLKDVEHNICNEKTFQQVKDVFFELHKQRQAYKLGRSIFEEEKCRNFFNDILVAFYKEDWIHFSYIRAEGKIISVVLGFKHNKRFSYWIPVFDPAFLKSYPGKVHLHNLIKQCFSDKYKVFDFMRGDEPYKFRWSNMQQESYEIILCKNNLYLMIHKAKIWIRRIIKNIFSTYPFTRKTLLRLSKMRLSI
jgi:CelD/BcsL family acetyltransferase involved in cellulose biosynthesis